MQYKQAKTDFSDFKMILKNPGDITYRQAIKGIVCGIQIFACFCVGEAIGRGSILGYKVGAPSEHNSFH